MTGAEAVGSWQAEEDMGRFRPPINIAAIVVIFDSVPDVIHLARRVLLTGFKPIFELAKKDEQCLADVLAAVRACNLPGFQLYMTSVEQPDGASAEKLYSTTLDAPTLLQILSEINIMDALKHAPADLWSEERKEQYDALLSLIATLLHALHVPEDDPAYLQPADYMATAAVCEDLFCLVLGREMITNYVHIFFHHIAQFLDIHGTIFQYSMQSLEAANYRWRKVYFRSTTHGLLGLPAVLQIMESANIQYDGFLRDVASILKARAYTLGRGRPAAKGTAPRTPRPFLSRPLMDELEECRNTLAAALWQARYVAEQTIATGDFPVLFTRTVSEDADPNRREYFHRAAYVNYCMAMALTGQRQR